MELIDTSRLVYTKVCPVDDPSNEQLAVLASDIKNIHVYSVTKSVRDYNLPIEEAAPDNTTRGNMPIDVALTVMKFIQGLSGVEKDAAKVLCDYVEAQIGEV